MTKNREMFVMEMKVLNAIKNKASFKLPIQAKTLRQDLGLSKRALEEIIESLRVRFEQPIVAKKAQPSGYYIPRTNEEREAGLAHYKNQIITEQRNLAAMQSVNLEVYWKNEKREVEGI